jgi:cysteinyl-tRNA synthetase
MKKLLAVLLVISAFLISGCGGNGDDGETGDEPNGEVSDYRQDMRTFVQGISAYAKDIQANFVIIPQNGHELLTENGEETGTHAAEYLEAIDGVGREDLFYGYTDDNVATPAADRNYMLTFMNIAAANGKEVMVTDYCSTPAYMVVSYTQCFDRGYISFAADHRELDNIPEYPLDPNYANYFDIASLADAWNFLYLLNTDSFSDRDDFLNELRGTNYDILLIDAFYDGTEALTENEVTSLKTKANGGARLVIAYMSIGEAENYRYYWQSGWNTTPPSWLAEENPDWPGNYKVRFWLKSWQDIIYGNDNSYLKKILDAGFDGVYLDIIDAYEFFEDLKK